MTFMIKSEVSEQYLLEEDAVEGFRQAVSNGQIRLALQILVDIVDVFEGFIASVLEDDDEEHVKEETKSIDTKEEDIKATEKDSSSIDQTIVEKKTSSKKTSSKEEETKTTAE